MRVGIYNPYLDSLGGGERYVLDIASCLSQDHEVSVFWDDPEILSAAQKRFGIDLSGVRVVPNIWKTKNIAEKLRKSSKFDVLFYVSDGSIPITGAKKTILIFQFPVPWVMRNDLLTWWKLRRISTVICYSQFVKSYIDSIFRIRSIVLAPCVDTRNFSPGSKSKIILSVGRFTQGQNTKKQEVMISQFKDLYTAGYTDWSLVLAGGLLSGDTAFVQKLQKAAKGYPIELVPNISLPALQKLYKSATLYWHAAGFGEDLARHPERAEHFGLTTIEAMSYACVPLVYNGGGQAEIVRHTQDGFVWKTTEELIHYTKMLIGDPQKTQKMSQAAQKRALEYGKTEFCQRVRGLVS